MTNTQCQHKFTRCKQKILQAANKTKNCTRAGRCEELEPTDSLYWCQFADNMASFLRKEIQAAVREEVSRVIGSSTDPIPTTTGTTFRSSTAETRTGVSRFPFEFNLKHRGADIVFWRILCPSRKRTSGWICTTQEENEEAASWQVGSPQKAHGCRSKGGLCVLC